MKKLILVTFLLAGSINLPAQIFKTYADTANYLISQIEDKKALYIGKPFSVLYDSLKIKPVYFIPNFSDIDINNKADYGKTIDFEFNLYRDFSKSHYIILYFESWPSYDTLYPIYFPGIDKPTDISAIVNLYRPLIVKDIILKDYSEDDPVDPNVMAQQE